MIFDDSMQKRQIWKRWPVLTLTDDLFATFAFLEVREQYSEVNIIAKFTGLSSPVSGFQGLLFALHAL